MGTKEKRKKIQQNIVHLVESVSPDVAMRELQAIARTLQTQIETVLRKMQQSQLQPVEVQT